MKGLAVWPGKTGCLETSSLSPRVPESCRPGCDCQAGVRVLGALRSCRVAWAQVHFGASPWLYDGQAGRRRAARLEEPWENVEGPQPDGSGRTTGVLGAMRVWESGRGTGPYSSYSAVVVEWAFGSGLSGSRTFFVWLLCLDSQPSLKWRGRLPERMDGGFH